MSLKIKAIIVGLIVLAIVSAIVKYGNFMYESGENAERTKWQKLELVEKEEHTRLLTQAVEDQKAQTQLDILAERKKHNAQVATLKKKLKDATRVDTFIENTPDTECLDSDGLQLINEILSNS